MPLRRQGRGSSVVKPLTAVPGNTPKGVNYLFASHRVPSWLSSLRGLDGFLPLNKGEIERGSSVVKPFTAVSGNTRKRVNYGFVSPRVLGGIILVVARS